MTLLYFGPETMMPLASGIAAVAGAVLLFWRRIIALLRGILAWLSRRVSGRGVARAGKDVETHRDPR